MNQLSSNAWHLFRPLRNGAINDNRPKQVFNETGMIHKVDCRKQEQTTQRGAPIAVLRLNETYLGIGPGRLISLGRAFDEQIRLKHHHAFPLQNLSRLHAFLGVDSLDRVFIFDNGTNGTGSTNGTFVNGDRLLINQTRLINENDEIWLGEPGSKGSLKIELVNLIQTKGQSFISCPGS